ncbi:hypothetical protein [Roseomonas elaeocarpi]|uniref:Uncharacterized protein n=1 Tax=Roseomonas elaeocarpi TaxID=907779 RepID=A0ABV6JY88_9PROT
MRLRTLLALAGLLLAVGFGVGDAEAARRGEGAHTTNSRTVSVGRAGAKAVVATRARTARPAAAQVATAGRHAGAATRQRMVVSRGAAPRRVATAARGMARTRTVMAATGRKGGHATRTVASRMQMNRSEMRAVASNTCLRRDARGRCTGARLAGFVPSAQAAQPRRTWHSGLPDVDAEQMACPEGTLATLARGHTDTIRCMPL